MVTHDDRDSMMTYLPEIALVAIRAPPFWKANPTFCFAQIEAEFANANIVADKAKFNQVIAAIESEILAHFAESEQHRLRLLLQDIELGDQHLSQLLRKMRDLATNRISDDVLKTLWLQHLPIAARQILAVSGEDLAKAANLADKICEVTALMGQIQTVSPPSTTISHTDAISKLKEQIAQLSLRIQQITESKSYRRSRHRSRRLSSPHRKRSTTEQKQICWYHRKFGDQANKCTSPCQFQAGN
ncbi:uncharacterized protein [Centruroides vittatus]|uniref:uncharacterized protein n=1 Tax=Centruroides vittatus TaxID=120091 RepID=UPI00350F8860